MSRLLVIGYHNVGPTWFWPYGPGVGLDGLVAQVRVLRRVGTVMRLGDAVAALRDGARLPPRAIALTFDDGYRDNLDLAVPALERLGVPATFFLVPGFLDRSVGAWWETLSWAVARARTPEADVRGHRLVAGDTSQPALAALAEDLKHETLDARHDAVAEVVSALDPSGDVGTDRLFMDWDGARDLAGRMEVGCHTGRHAILARETPEDQRRDLTESRDRLQRELGVDIDLLAYPNGQPGDMDEATFTATRDAGFVGAVTTVDGLVAPGVDPLAMNRVVLDPATGLRGLKTVFRRRDIARFLLGR